MSKDIIDLLNESIEILEDRNKKYGNTYEKHGGLLTTLFPDGLELSTPDDFNRFMILTLMLGKVMRYCFNFKNGGHDDSLIDLCNYTTILRKIDHDMVKNEESK